MISAPNPDDPCLCGSGVSWSACHDQTNPAIPAADIPVDERLDSVVLSLGLNILSLFETALAAIKIDRANRDRRLAQVCLAFFASKLHRVTLAGLTLIRHKQGTEALTLKREQYYYWLSMYYYAEKQDQAVLFMASQPLRQRDGAKEIMAFDEKTANDPKRQRQLAELERQCAEVYREFPAVRRARGKSGNTANPVWIDWPEPGAREMIDVVAPVLVREAAARKNETLDQKTFDERARRAASHIHFYHADWPGKQKHGTPLSLNLSLDFDPDFTIKPGEAEFGDPNSLAWDYLHLAVSALRLLCVFNDLDLSERYNKLYRALQDMGACYGFETSMFDPSA